MTNALTLIAFVALVNSAIAYSIGGRSFMRNCRVEDEIFKCRVNFTAEELFDIQNKDFVISEVKIIQFEDSNVGIVNENFFTKFPNAEEVIFKDSHLRLTSSFNATSHNSIYITNISFLNGFIGNNLRSNAFEKLSKLEEVTFDSVSFEYPELDTELFQGNKAIKVLKIANCNITSVDSKTFAKMSRLLSLTLSGNIFQNLPQELFENNFILESLFFESNRVKRLQLNFFPETLKELSIRGNDIIFLTTNQFQNLSKLEFLDLSENKIQILSNTILTNHTSLKVLKLNNNNLKKISSDHFYMLPSLEELYLQRNSIQDIESEAFIRLNELHTLNLSFNPIKLLTRKHFKEVPLNNKLFLEGGMVVDFSNDCFDDLEETDVVM
ncbi:Tl.2 family protein [Megaselia abdita]